jgi:LEA14-like dessication related protein
LVGLVVFAVVLGIIGWIIVSLREPEVTAKSIRFLPSESSWEDRILAFELLLDVYNDNMLGCKVSSVTADIYLDGSWVGKAWTREAFELAPHHHVITAVLLKLYNVGYRYLSYIREPPLRVHCRGVAEIILFLTSFDVPFEVEYRAA